MTALRIRRFDNEEDPGSKVGASRALIKLSSRLEKLSGVPMQAGLGLHDKVFNQIVRVFREWAKQAVHDAYKAGCEAGVSAAKAAPDDWSFVRIPGREIEIRFFDGQMLSFREGERKIVRQDEEDAE